MHTNAKHGMNSGFILLASTSPRRHTILQQLGIAHGVLPVPKPAGADEPQLIGEQAADYVQRTARDKALQAYAWLNSPALRSTGSATGVAGFGADWPANWLDCPILTADTSIILDDVVFGKPGSAAHACEILATLAGREHEVHSAVVLCKDGVLYETLSISKVLFDTISPAEIKRYVASGECFGKSGAYAIQGLAGAFIKRIEGSFSGIMGLPAYETSQLIKQYYY